MTKSSNSTANFDLDKWQSGSGAKATDRTLPTGWGLKDTPFESYWRHLVTVKDGKFVVDGFSFRGRMATMKYLIAEMDDSYLWERSKMHGAAAAAASEPYLEYHWLWGYAAQLDWQFRSGRLKIGSSPPSSDEDRIAEASWWGYMNFCFSVCILEGARLAGVTTVPITYDPVSQDLLDNDEGAKACTSGWETLFRGGYVEYKKRIGNGNTTLSDEEFHSAHFSLRKHVWHSHTGVVLCQIGPDTTAIKNQRMVELMEKLPKPERAFGFGWCRTVELLGACALPTDLVAVLEDGAGYLPIRIVTEEDYERFLKDPGGLSVMEKRRFTVVKSCHDLSEASPFSMKVAIAFFQRVVRTAAISRSMPGRIVGLTHGDVHEKTKQMASVLFFAIIPRGTFEVGVFCACLAALIGIAVSTVLVLD